MLITVRSQSGTVRDLPEVEDLAKVERGWTAKDGVLTIKLPDRFEKGQIRISGERPSRPQ